MSRVPSLRRCDSVRRARNARACARLGSPCGPARGTGEAGSAGMNGEKRKSVRPALVLTMPSARATNFEATRAHGSRARRSRAREGVGNDRRFRVHLAAVARGRRGRRRVSTERALQARRCRRRLGAPGNISSGVARVSHLFIARQAQPRGVRAAEYQRFGRRAVVARAAHVCVRPSRLRRSTE